MLGFLANIFILGGFVYLLLQLYLTSKLKCAENILTGSQIPCVNFYKQMLDYFLIGFGFKKQKNPVEVLLDYKREYGETFAFWVGWTPMIFVSKYQDIISVLHDKEGKFYKGDPFNVNPTLPKVMGKSLVTVDGLRWKQQRGSMDPAFSYTRVKRLIPIFSLCAQKLVNKWKKERDGIIPVQKDLINVTMDTIGLAAFGYKFNALEEDTAMHEQLNNYNIIVKSMFRPLAFILPWVTKLPTKYNKELEYKIEEFQEFLHSTIINHTNKKDDSDLLDHITAMGKDLTPEEISHNLFMFFLAGNDTSSSCLTSCLYLMSKYPHMQERIYNEVKDVNVSQLTLDNINKLEYLVMFIKETLRYFPPVGMTTTRSTKEDTIMGKYLLKKDTLVAPSFWIYHFDERYWENPFVFNPERWKDNTSELLSFSTGPRFCLGKKFALAEMSVTLVHLIKNFKFTLVNENYERDYVPYSITILSKDNMPLYVLSR